MSDAASRKRHTAFVYDAERRQDAVQRRWMVGLTGLAFRAIRGNPEPLCDHLVSEVPLSADDRETLAWLVHRSLHRRPRGRPPGRAPGVIREAEYRAYVLVERWRTKVRARLSRRRLPKGKLDELIKEAITRIEEEFPETKGKVSAQNIRVYLKR